MPPDGGRLKRDLDADAVRAARAVLDDGLTCKAARIRYRIGRDRLLAMLAKLRAERARSTP